MAWVAGALNLVGGRRDNYFNKEEADKARDWSKEMSNTEVQRRVRDMRLAGINPMLAASAGASTPGSSTAAPSTSGGDVGDSIAGAYFSAQQMKMMKDKNAADVAQVEANTAKTVAETELIKSEIPFSAGNAWARSRSLDMGLHKLAAEIRTADSEAKVRELMPRAQELINRGMELDMSEREATSKFFEQIGEGSKWMELVRNLLLGIRSMR